MTGKVVAAAFAAAWVALIGGFVAYVATESNLWFAVWLTAGGYLWGDLTLFSIGRDNDGQEALR